MAQLEDTAQNILNILDTPPLLTITDVADSNTVYKGTAKWGTVTSSTGWTITKTILNCTVTTSLGVITISAIGSGTSIIVLRATAPGSISSNIWDNRTSLTYSAI